jgi:hypothetical protein
MPELEATWGRVLSAWWLIAWRGLVGGMGIGALFGLAVGLIGIALSTPQNTSTVAATIGGALLSLFWGIIVVRMALRKRYRVSALLCLRHEQYKARQYRDPVRPRPPHRHHGLAAAIGRLSRTAANPGSPAPAIPHCNLLT